MHKFALIYFNSPFLRPRTKVEHSVPQRSLLEPLLFLIYINDLIENVQGAKLVLFTDDPNLLITGKDKFDFQHPRSMVAGNILAYLCVHLKYSLK
jgi:hypothetical protein